MCNDVLVETGQGHWVGKRLTVLEWKLQLTSSFTSFSYRCKPILSYVVFSIILGWWLVTSFSVWLHRLALCHINPLRIRMQSRKTCLPIKHIDVTFHYYWNLRETHDICLHFLVPCKETSYFNFNYIELHYLAAVPFHHLLLQNTYYL